MKCLLFAIAFLVFSVATNAQTRRAASLAEQKMCSEQAEKFRDRHTVVLVNHYDKASNVCFVRTWDWVMDLNDANKHVGDSFKLQDAFEKFSLGECFTDAEGKVLMDGDGKVMNCWAALPSGKKEFRTSEEWNKYVTQTYLRD
jgi:hypothetical protein